LGIGTAEVGLSGLIGFRWQGDSALLLAYDDAAGVTTAVNLNLLTRTKRGLRPRVMATEQNPFRAVLGAVGCTSSLLAAA
jgi:uncharacterized SAM-dependent methyltransferase